MLNSARDEWDRAHHAGAGILIPYKEYENLLLYMAKAAVTMDKQFNAIEADEELAAFDKKIDDEYAARAIVYDEIEDNDLICELMEEEEIELSHEFMEKLHKGTEELESKHKYWFLYIFPNGNIDSYGSESLDDEFNKRLKLCQESQVKIGGILVNNLREPNETAPSN